MNVKLKFHLFGSLLIFLLSIDLKGQESYCFDSTIPNLLSTQQEIDEFILFHPGSAIGDLTICGEDIVNLEGLSHLTWILGDIQINCPNLTSFHGLHNVQTLDNWFYGIGIRAGISDLTGLESLEAGFLHFRNCPNLSDLNGLSSAINIGIKIEDCPQFSSFEGVALDDCVYELRIEGQHQLSNFQGLEGQTALARLELENTLIPSFIGLNNVTEIAYLNIIGTEIVSFEGLQNVELINTLQISGLSYNPNFAGFTSLSEVDRFWIEFNSGLESLYGFPAGMSINNEISIINNPSLQYGAIPAICYALSNDNFNAEINENAPGCNSIEEVLSACQALEFDLDGDSMIGIGDLLILLGDIECTSLGECQGDLNEDGVVNLGDVLLLLALI